METNTSPYLLIFRETSPDVYKAMSPDERQRLLEKWNNWYDGLAAEGKVQHGHPLEPKVRIVSGTRGERVVDGPFAETTEVIGGYFLLTVSSFEEATEIAKNCPSLYLGLKVEVRAIAASCPELGVKGRPSAKDLSAA